jgi:hypothetical protein
MVSKHISSAKAASLKPCRKRRPDVAGCIVRHIVRHIVPGL